MGRRAIGAVAVLGGGNGGFAAAAHLAAQGHEVRLWSRSPATLAPVQQAGGIAYSGVCGEGVACPSLATTDLAAAVRNSELLVICLPATAHEELAAALAPLLDAWQRVVLNPGATGGALAFRRALTEAGGGRVALGETNTLTYIARKRDPTSVHISSAVRNVRVAALPGGHLAELVGPLLGYYPSLVPVPNVLHTSLRNVNAVLHPPGIIMAAAWIEHTGGDFNYYSDGGTPGVAQVMADLDGERLAVASAWSVEVEPFPALFGDIGSSSARAAADGSFYEMLQDSEPNRLIKAPASLDHRYLLEDIPFGLVPMSEMGRAAGVPTPIMDALITLASSLSRRDLRAQGWTLARLGLPPDLEAARQAVA